LGISTSELELIKQHIGIILKKNKLILTKRLELNTFIQVGITLHARFKSRGFSGTLPQLWISECRKKVYDSKILVSCMVRGFFRPVPYLAFPLYRNSASGNGTETRDTIYAEDNKLGTQ